MKQEIANCFLLIGSIIAILCVIIKFVLWVRLRSPKRIGFLKSFAVWFSKNDIHDATSQRSRIFLYCSNIINCFFWAGILFLLVWFVCDTESVDSNQQHLNKKR